MKRDLSCLVTVVTLSALLAAAQAVFSSCGKSDEQISRQALARLSANVDNADTLLVLRREVAADSQRYASMPSLAANESARVRGAAIAVALSPARSAAYVIENGLSADVFGAVYRTYSLTGDTAGVRVLCTALQSAFDRLSPEAQAKYVVTVGSPAAVAALLGPGDAALCRELRRIYSRDADALAEFEQAVRRNRQAPQEFDKTK